jgi:hypothetical protein
VLCIQAAVTATAAWAACSSELWELCPTVVEEVLVALRDCPPCAKWSFDQVKQLLNGLL